MSRIMNNSYNRNLFNNNTSSFNVTNSNNTTYNYTTVSDEESRILSWISPLESWERHSDVARTRAKGVGEWVLKSSRLRAWREERNDQSVGGILFCPGVPGAGKTFICSLVIDTLCDETAGQNVAVGCLYCDYRGQKEQTAEVMIGSLLRQFVAGLREIPEAVIQVFGEARPHLGGRALELAKIIELFPAALGHFRQVFICVDALDEFVPEYRAQFLRSLRQILDKSPNTRLFLTARPHIQSEVESSIPLPMRIITIQPLFGDIEKYLATKLDTDPHPRAMDAGLRSEIMTKIPKESSEIFLLVTLQIDSILGEITIGGRRKKLREMTNDLSDAYTATLERIKKQRGALARSGISALMWISLAERPLLIDELCHALAMEIGSPNIDAEMVPPIETIVECCMGLVTIDHASSTVRLVHATLQEYLRSHQDNVFQSPHATMAEICLSYMAIQSVRELPPDLKTAPRAFPLLAYASSHWGAHARGELTKSVKHLALGILDRYPQHVAANIFLFNGGAPWHLSCSSVGFSGLHYSAYFGIEELVEAQLSMGSANSNQADGWGRTPLTLAAERGNEGVVKILLNRTNVNPNSADQLGQTPLFLASGNGHEEVVKCLLNRTDVNPNSADRYERTPLFLASGNGHEGVVKIILSRADANPNSADWLGQTPLFRAAENGHEGVISILLSHANINPNAADGGDRTPLFRASENRHPGVVRGLLSRPDVNPNLETRDSQTPLSQASVNGYEEVVRILLSRADVNPNSANEVGRTPLFLASTNGHEGVVRALLSRSDINPNSRDWSGQTPLFRASDNGHEGTVRILLSRADVNPNMADGGQTPLLRASENGYEGVVRVLLSRKDVNPNSPDEGGRTPLSWASTYGREGVVGALLGRADVNPNLADWSDQTPLSKASENGHEGVVRMLLSHADVHPDLADHHGQTPLSLASERGREGVVRSLLSHPRVNPNSEDWLGQTPLFGASTNGHEGVVRILLSRSDVNPNSANLFGNTPLRIATLDKHHGIVNLLRTRQKAP